MIHTLHFCAGAIMRLHIKAALLSTVHTVFISAMSPGKKEPNNVMPGASEDSPPSKHDEGNVSNNETFYAKVSTTFRPQTRESSIRGSPAQPATEHQGGERKAQGCGNQQLEKAVESLEMYSKKNSVVIIGRDIKATTFARVARVADWTARRC